MKEKVLIVNKFYYRRGGDCTVAMSTESLLKEHGHEVAVFAMQYPENVPSDWSDYFPSEISFSGGVGNKLRALRRTLGLGDVKRQFARLLNDFRPDVVHIHNIHSYLSPVVARLAHKYGARVVWSMHDYKLMCPGYSCRRNGMACELCFTDKSQVLKQRCMKGSLAASVVAYLEALKWNRKALTEITDTFLCPSQFMAGKLIQGGFPENKIATLCNFLSIAPRNTATENDGEPYYCYVGRLSDEKGVATMLKAAASLPYRLKVAGDGPLSDELRQKYAGHNNISFLGRINADEVASLLAGAHLSVIPSECYENNPMGAIESLCSGTPVVGANIGGIPELIDSSCGEIFESGNAEDMAKAITRAWESDYNRPAIAATSIEKFSRENYYRRLIEIYNRR